MAGWSGYRPLEQVQQAAGARTPAAVTAALAESATALTAALAVDDEAIERYLAERDDSGRPAWHALGDASPRELTEALLGEIPALIGHVLSALRSRAIDRPGDRLAAYDAIDLASFRAGQVTAALPRLPGLAPPTPTSAPASARAGVTSA